MDAKSNPSGISNPALKAVLPPPPPTLTVTLRNKFIAGLVIIVPILITVNVLWWLFGFVDGLAQPIFVALVGRPIPGIGFIITMAIVFLAGVLFSAGPLQRLLHGIEELVDTVPVVGMVYGTIKKVLAGFGDPEQRSAFQRFVFARLPGRTTPGFVTNTFTMRRTDNTVYRLCAVYIPTNHLYVGDVVVLPEEDVIDTDLTVEDGVSIILSAGASLPAFVVEKLPPKRWS
jgi:uncharacterized membrane protein